MLLLSEMDAVQALVEGRHADPFSLLGMHVTQAGVEVRAFLPGALSVVVLDKKTGRRSAALAQQDERGFFSGSLPRRRRPFAYLLEVRWPDGQAVLEDPYRFGPQLQETDVWLLAQGTHLRPYECMGAHPDCVDGVDGVRFCVWAPNARRVSVVGEFNFWDGRRHPMRLRPENGVWELFLPDARPDQLYKYELLDSQGALRLKADPYAFACEAGGRRASRIARLPDTVMTSLSRQRANAPDAPITIYEAHLGSWQRHAGDNGVLSYAELADTLIPYVRDMGFTHLELLPVSEHPFSGSWGYQPLGLYAPTSRHGRPEDLRRFIQKAHKAGLNVILDWVPGHFPDDEFGLVRFDGTALYEYADPREGCHPDWNTLVYNYGRHEVRNYLSGNALYWLERFGADGLRVDAVASMLYRDYSRSADAWIPNHLGGRENFEAMEFLRGVNRVTAQERPGAALVAEESTAFAGVTASEHAGGLGFSYKWNMGWMHDTLRYMERDPAHRRHHHDDMTFGMVYAHAERFILPLSHDEVVHGKGSLLDRMPGDCWQKFAGLRAYYGFMWGFPGKKLLFMGNEFAQGRQWNHEAPLDWHLLQEPGGWHLGVQRLVRDLNGAYCSASALHQLDCDPSGFCWLVMDDRENSVFAFSRRDRAGNEALVVSNFTPVPRYAYRIGVDEPARYRELINTDSQFYGGGNMGNFGTLVTEQTPSHGLPCSLCLTLPPLSTLYLSKETI